MTITSQQVVAWAAAARAGLAAARGGIDAVNVFPVADADTGTNAWLTVGGGADAVAAAVAEHAHLRAPLDPAELLAVFARGAMLAARGNSGVILSQWLAGYARRAVGGPDAAAGALGSAARAARAALGDPQEGTVLTLADEVAQAAALACDAGVPVAAALAQAAATGHQALGRISAEHPVLRRAHVPDAGACALLVVVDALAAALADRPAPDPSSWLPRRGPGSRTPDASGEGCATPERAPGAGAYEVMLVVRGTAAGDEVGAGLRTALGRVGDSVAVVGADGWWHVHVHTDEPARAIEACAVGVREQVVVRRLDVVDVLGPETVTGPHGAGLVVVTGAPGLAHWYATAGAVVVVACPDAPATEAHVRRAVEDTGADHVVVVPAGALGDQALVALNTSPDVTLVAAPDDAVAAAVTLAYVTGGETAAQGAASRARPVRVPVEGGPRAVADAVADLLADAGGTPPENVTVVLPGDPDDALAAGIDDAVAGLGFEPTVLGGGAGGRMLIALD